MDIFHISLVGLSVHSLYSVVKFYTPVTKLLRDFWLKKLSVVLGTVAQVLLWTLALGSITTSLSSALALLAFVLAIAHFWTMEVDFKYRLGVRPFGMAPFFLAPFVVICWTVFRTTTSA